MLTDSKPITPLTPEAYAALRQKGIGVLIWMALASAATLAMMNPANAQGYISPGYLGGTYVAPGYVAPSYPAPGQLAPSYVAPGVTAPGYTAPGNIWRRQRADEDWRNNT